MPGSTLGNVAKFVGGNAAAAGIFMLASKLLEPYIYGRQEEAAPAATEEGPSEGVDPRILALLQGRGRGRIQGNSIINDLVLENSLKSELASSQGRALGTSYKGGTRYVSPELQTLLQGYDDQLANIGAGRPRSYAQIMAELGEF